VALKEASHCDFEDPTNNFCRVLCGGSSAQMQARVRSETVRATLELLAMAGARSEAATPDAAPEGADAPGPPERVGPPEPDATTPP